jgi:hypothetical protein
MNFREVCAECLDNKDFVKEWNRLTGNKLGEARTPLQAAIDTACGYDPDEKAMPEFIEFVHEYIWLPLLARYEWEMAQGAA